VNLDFQTQDERITVQVTRRGDDWQLMVDGREVPLQARPGGAGEWLVETHQGIRRLWVAVRGDERLVFCDGRVHTFKRVDPHHEDEGGPDGSSPGLVATMPGKVVRTVVKQGESVVAGQTLLIMESMKMETELTAGMAGVVTRIHVEEGQLVSQGTPLVDVEPDGDPS